MAKIDAATVERWRGIVEDHLGRDGGVFTPNLILTGVVAWTIAHNSGIVHDAYYGIGKGKDIHDAHIQTALEKIFPNCVFRDKKRY